MLILDVSILHVGCWGVFGFFVRLAILVNIAIPRVTQALATVVLGVHVSSVADDVVVTLATHFIRTKCEKCFNFFLCDKLNKASLEGSRRLSKEGKKHPSELSFFPLCRLGNDEANLRRSVAERSAVSRPAGPQRSVSVSSGNRKIT